MKLIKRKTMKQKTQVSGKSEDQYPDRLTDACFYTLVAFCIIGVLTAVIFSFLA